MKARAVKYNLCYALRIKSHPYVYEHDDMKVGTAVSNTN